MSELQQAAAEAMLQDPAVENLASFVGVDAANNTMLHTGRMLINLKADRSGDAAGNHGAAARAGGAGWRASRSTCSRRRT